jgi:hypothetical protein
VKPLSLHHTIRNPQSHRAKSKPPSDLFSLANSPRYACLVVLLICSTPSLRVPKPSPNTRALRNRFVITENRLVEGGSFGWDGGFSGLYISIRDVFRSWRPIATLYVRYNMEVQNSNPLLLLCSLLKLLLLLSFHSGKVCLLHCGE